MNKITLGRCTAAETNFARNAKATNALKAKGTFRNAMVVWDCGIEPWSVILFS